MPIEAIMHRPQLKWELPVGLGYKAAWHGTQAAVGPVAPATRLQPGAQMSSCCKLSPAPPSGAQASAEAASPASPRMLLISAGSAGAKPAEAASDSPSL